MSEANRQAIERMFARVIAAARKFGMPDDEIMLIVEIELGGGADISAKAVGTSVLAPAKDESVPSKPGPDKVVPELDEPEPDWGSEGRPPGEIPTLEDGEPLTLESLGLGQITQPVQLKPPPHTEEEKDLIEGMLK